MPGGGEQRGLEDRSRRASCPPSPQRLAAPSGARFLCCFLRTERRHGGDSVPLPGLWSFYERVTPEGRVCRQQRSCLGERVQLRS